MILYEYEGKDLLKKAGINVPDSHLIDSISGLEDDSIIFPVVLKAQILSGKRAAVGGIIPCDDLDACKLKASNLLGSSVNQETVEKVLVESKIIIQKEYYISLSYDTSTRTALLTVTEEGGTGVEERAVTTVQLDPNNPYTNLPQLIPEKIITPLIELFFSSDCLLLEINPLVETPEGEWIALDAKIKLDDYAASRHPEWNYPPRSVPGHIPTKGEMLAKKIDEEDHRGTAGSSYFDLPGDIAVLSSGGGVSLTAMDSLVKVGGKPANFTEYSGNPPKEKVAKLTKIVLDKPNIHGLWVIGTVVANFTDIYETLSGLIDGLRLAQTELNTRFDFPIVIRRGGPREAEAYRMLEEIRDLDIHLLGAETSIAQAAKIMVDLSSEYAQKTKKPHNVNNTLDF